MFNLDSSFLFLQKVKLAAFEEHFAEKVCTVESVVVDCIRNTGNAVLFTPFPILLCLALPFPAVFNTFTVLAMVNKRYAARFFPVLPFFT